MELVKKTIEQDIEEFMTDYNENSKDPNVIVDYLEDCLIDYGFEVVKNEDAAYEYCQKNTSHKTEIVSGEFWGGHFSQTEEIDNDVEYKSFDVAIFGHEYTVFKAECEGVYCYYVEPKNTNQNVGQDRKRA